MAPHGGPGNNQGIGEASIMMASSAVGPIVNVASDIGEYRREPLGGNIGREPLGGTIAREPLGGTIWKDPLGGTIWRNH